MGLIGLPMVENTEWITNMPLTLLTFPISSSMAVLLILLNSLPVVTTLPIWKLKSQPFRETKWRVSGGSTWHIPTATTKSDTRFLLPSVLSIQQKLNGWRCTIQSPLEEAGDTMGNIGVATVDQLSQKMNPYDDLGKTYIWYWYEWWNGEIFGWFCIVMKKKRKLILRGGGGGMCIVDWCRLSFGLLQNWILWSSVLFGTPS